MLAIPGFVGSALDPLIGAGGDTTRRRTILVAGGIGFAVSAALSSFAVGFWTLLVALVIGNPATGAFVSLAQATLMDLAPDARERNMARWTLAGSFGYVGGPVLLAGALWVGAGWRAALLALAIAALLLASAGRRVPSASTSDAESFGRSLIQALSALRRRDVLRRLGILESADLLLDVFHGFLALYFVDVAHARPATAALAVAVWTGAGLVGDWLLLFVLRRFDGDRYLRFSAALALVVYPAFLLVPDTWPKLVLLVALGLLNSGWYAIPKAALYESFPGRSGAAIAVAGIAGTVGAAVPLTLGFVAGSAGLGPTMWILLVGPLALFAGSRR